MNVTTIVPFFGGVTKYGGSHKANRVGYLEQCMESVKNLWPVVYVCNEEDLTTCRRLGYQVMLIENIEPQHLPYYACKYVQDNIKEGVVIYTEADQVFSFNTDVVGAAVQCYGYISPHRFEEDYKGIVFDLHRNRGNPIQQVLGKTFVVNNYQKPSDISKKFYHVTDGTASYGGAWVCSIENLKKVEFSTPDELTLEHPAGVDLFRAIPCYKTTNPYGFYVNHLSAIEFHKKAYLMAYSPLKIDYTGFEPLPLNIQGWGGNDSFFGKMIERVKPNTIIEVGTWLGQSAINMAEQCKRLNLDTRMYCVDTWLGALEFVESHGERNLSKRFGYPQVYYQFLSNVYHKELTDVITPFPQTSLIAARWFAKNSIKADLIYIDGSHDYDDVYKDIEYYLPLLNDGGVLFGDDIDAWAGVRGAVNNFCKDKGINFKEDGRFWWIE